MERSKLKQEVVDQILASETIIGMIADRAKIKGESLRKNIERRSQQLCLPHFQAAICEVLGLPAGSEITETYSLDKNVA